MQSKSNATNEIKQKLLIVHKKVSSRICRFVDQGALFKGLLPPLEVGGELAFDDEMPDPLQGRLHCLLGQPDGLQQILFSG